ncbi:MAG: hypothetical protein AB7R89_03345 [Dehalococcoidia bacterium]
MTSGRGQGPGVRRFWEYINQGEEPDLHELRRSFPEEAAALAQAAVQAAKQQQALTQEQLWINLHRTLFARNENIDVGAALKQRRLALGLSESALVQRLAQDGLRISPVAIQRLESQAVNPWAVKPPSVWRALSQALSFDPTHLITLLELSAQQPREVQQFTRMARGATGEDREEFLAETRDAGGADVQRYLAEVRQELGLPPRALSQPT